MDMVALTATARDTSAKPGKLRRDGQVPCVIYGHGVSNTSIVCQERELHRAFVKAGESTLVEIDLGGKKIPVLFKHLSFDPITGREIHVDFYAVNMKEEIEAPVPVRFTGEAPAVKDHGGIFVVTQETVTVRCLPADLPHELTIDVSGMAELHTSVSVKDIAVPKNVKVMDDVHTVLATVQEPRKEEEIAPTPAAEGAVPAEGAAAPAEGAAPGSAPAAAAAPAAEEKGKKK